MLPAQEWTVFLEISKATLAGDTNMPRSPSNRQRSIPQRERGAGIFRQRLSQMNLKDHRRRGQMSQGSGIEVKITYSVKGS
jgi:hypothetical protein